MVSVYQQTNCMLVCHVCSIKKISFLLQDIESNTKNKWIFFHTGPRGKEVGDNLFLHQNSRTFDAFENFHYISAALMAYVIKDHKF